MVRETGIRGGGERKAGRSQSMLTWCAAIRIHFYPESRENSEELLIFGSQGK